MSRSGDVAAMLDIRSAAILQDVVFASNPCAPGASKGRKPSHQFYGPYVLYPGDSGYTEDEFKRYDKTRDWIACIAAAVITGTILGIVHSFGILIPFLNVKYKVGQVEAIIVGALTYAVLIMFGPLACCLIKCMGQRLTCVFGMLLFFIGLMVDAFQIHRAIFFVTHIVCLGIGGSLAYTSAVSSVVDHFRESLPIAVVIISVSSPIGTALYYSLSHLLIQLFQIYGPEKLYQWLQLILAVIVLCMITATHVFPTRLPRHLEGSHEKPRGLKVKECIENTNQPPPANRDPCGVPLSEEDPDDEQKSCLCVCVIDVSVWTDLSFLLWALISLCAVLTFFIPYLFLEKYAREIVPPIGLGNTLHLILWYCLASLIARIATILGTDHTFTYNRSMFQGILLGSGILYLFVANATTFGWITVWALVVGAIEGTMTTVIPRVTLQTIPRKWMASSWSYIVIMHGFGILMGPLIVVSAWAGTAGFYGVGFVMIGIAQIIAALLAFILPNEEDEDDEDSNSSPQSLLPPLRSDSYYFGPNSYTKRLAEYTATHGGAGGRSFISDYTTSDCCKYSGLDGYSSISSYTTGIGNCSLPGHPYSTDCPICSKIGCIPGCCDMGLPGLTSMGIQSQSFGTTAGLGTSSRFNQSPQVSGFAGTSDPFDPCLTEMPSSSGKSNFGAPNSASGAPKSTSGDSKTAPVGVVKPSVGPQKPTSSDPHAGPSDGTVKRVNIEIRQKTTPTNSVSAPKTGPKPK